jgi:hypothetical protein
MITTTLPRLTSLGLELDTSAECFGELRSASHLLSDVGALRERMREDGYLYLPGYLDRDQVLEARQVLLHRLAEGGHLDDRYPVPDAIARPGADIAFKPDLAKDNAPLLKLLYGGRMMEFYERFLGGEVRHFDYTWMRAMGPGRGTAPHCDIVFMGRGTTSLYTAWTPLGDISYEIGGLMILENSHRHEKLRANYGAKDVDEYCTNRRDAPPSGLGGGGNIGRGGSLSRNPVRLRQRLGGRWLTTEYRAGDLLTFSMYTVHASIDNRSNQIRLSSDTRYQLASEPVDERWVGENPIGHGMAAKRGRIC